MSNGLDTIRDLEPLPNLEDYPHFAEAVRFRREEFAEYLEQLDEHISEEVPEGYIQTDWYQPIEDAANPHVVVPLFLKRHGAPVTFTKERIVYDHGVREGEEGDVLNVWVAPDINDAYQQLWHEMFHLPSRQLANAMARGIISPYDAFTRSFHIAPLVNKHILWAHGQGILERAYVTSALREYERLGVHRDLGSLWRFAGVIEKLIAERATLPFSLDTILGMGVVTAVSVLAKHPELVDELKLDSTNIPSVDLDKIGYDDEQFERDYYSYWEPLIAKLEAEEKENNTSNP